MYDLNALYTLVSERSRPPKTGRTTSDAAGDTRPAERRSLAHPRFTDNGNGTVTDNLTGLIWLKNANCFSSKTWSDALIAANTLNSGECALTDGSVEGEWRLPNVRELSSLIDYGRHNPALPTGHPFTYDPGYYWSSTPYMGDSAVCLASSTYLWDGFVNNDRKSIAKGVWPVSGGQ